MANELAQSAVNVLLAPKSAATVAAGTMAVGWAERFSLIPWGDVAAFVGTILSVVMIITRIASYLLDRKRALLEIRKLREELKSIDQRKGKRG